MDSFLGLINRLLPFATPGTPLLQDIVHLFVICLLLYFAPQIQQKFQLKRTKSGLDGTVDDVSGVDRTNGVEDEDILDTNAPPPTDLHVEEPPGQNNLNDERGLEDLNEAPADGQPGPAQGAASSPRNIGAKKAKSLARKDQRRAYNEFMRSQGEAQRARDAEGADERDAELAAEKERRRATERALEARKAKEREAKRERDEKERNELSRRTTLALDIVRDELSSRRMCNLFEVASVVGPDIDEEWVERVVKASGMVGKKGDDMIMITETGWVVHVTAVDMTALYSAAIESDVGDDNGKVHNDDLGTVLEKLLKQTRTD